MSTLIETRPFDWADSAFPRCRSVNRHKLCFGLCILLGLGVLLDGVWIQAKARLAQYLIADAWARTLAGEEQVKPWPWADTWPVAVLRIGDHAPFYVLAGADGSSLAFGPGHLHGSSVPGSPGVTVIAGHRDTHFSVLDGITIGTPVVIVDRSGRRSSYKVNSRWVADANQGPLMLERQKQSLVLVTCYPFEKISSGGSLRYVVEALPDIYEGLTTNN